MEVEETTEQNADEVNIPAESVEDGQEEVLDPAAGADDKQIPETDEAKTDFRSLFGKARQSAESRQTDDSEGEKVEEPKSDEQIPGEEKSETEEPKEKSEEEIKDEPKDEPKTTKRSESFRKMEQERDDALAQVTEVNQRLTSLDEKFAQHGGVEVVETALELYDLASDKTKASEFVQKINSLPHKGAIQREIFDNVLDLPANRVYGINRVLKEDFGLTGNISQPFLEKFFEFATSRLNTDPEAFESFLDRELELSAEPESELDRLRKENEALKNPPKEEQKEEAQQESQAEFASRIQRTYNDFEDSTFDRVSKTELSKYGFSPLSNDTSEVKAAKEYLSNAVKFAVAVEMRQAKAHETLLDYWIEKTPEDNKFYSQARKSYENAMTIKVQNALKAIAPLLGAKPEEKSKEIPKETKVETAAKGGKSELPAPKKEKREPLGFRAAFGNARKAVSK